MREAEGADEVDKGGVFVGHVRGGPNRRDISGNGSGLALIGVGDEKVRGELFAAPLVPLLFCETPHEFGEPFDFLPVDGPSCKAIEAGVAADVVERGAFGKLIKRALADGLNHWMQIGFRSLACAVIGLDLGEGFVAEQSETSIGIDAGLDFGDGLTVRVSESSCTMKESLTRSLMSRSLSQQLPFGVLAGATSEM